MMQHLVLIIFKILKEDSVPREGAKMELTAECVSNRLTFKQQPLRLVEGIILTSSKISKVSGLLTCNQLSGTEGIHRELKSFQVRMGEGLLYSPAAPLLFSLILFVSLKNIVCSA
jgi:hypothetical protein